MARWRILLLFGAAAIAGYWLMFLGLSSLLEQLNMSTVGAPDPNLPPARDILVAGAKLATGLVLLASLILCRKAVLPTEARPPAPGMDWMTLLVFSLLGLMGVVQGVSYLQEDPTYAAWWFIQAPSHLSLAYLALRRLLNNGVPHGSR